MTHRDENDLTTDADVECPHCGAPVTIGLDPGGGSRQDYVEDCQVCCQPWIVRVTWNANGIPAVELEPA